MAAWGVRAGEKERQNRDAEPGDFGQIQRLRRQNRCGLLFDLAVGLAHVEDLGGGISYGGGDIVDDQFLSDLEIVEVILGGGRRLAGSIVIVGLGGAGNQSDGGGKRDSYQVPGLRAVPLRGKATVWSIESCTIVRTLEAATGVMA